MPEKRKYRVVTCPFDVEAEGPEEAATVVAAIVGLNWRKMAYEVEDLDGDEIFIIEVSQGDDGEESRD